MSVASTFLFITNFDVRFAIFRAVDSLGGGADTLAARALLSLERGRLHAGCDPEAGRSGTDSSARPAPHSMEVFWKLYSID